MWDAVMLPLLLACTGGDATPHDSKPKGDSVDTGSTDSGDSSESMAETDTAGDTDTAEDTDTGAETGDSSVVVDSCGTVLDTDPEEIPPRECDSTLPWIGVSAGAFLTCGVKSDGCGQCWGGDADTEEYRIPGLSFATIQLSSLVDEVEDVSPHICGLTDAGEIRCWGGTNRHHENDAPVGTFVSLATGETTATAVRDDGAVVQWGAYGGCESEDYTMVVGSFYNYAAIRADGDLELFDAIDDRLTVAGPWMQVTHGGYYVCGLRADPPGSLSCVAGDGTEDTAVEFDGDPTGPFLDVCVSPFGDVCVLSVDGSPTCYGELVGTPVGPFVDLSCGDYHTCGLTAAGDIECWGDDFGGETTPPS